jgi:hypothetical protein
MNVSINCNEEGSGGHTLHNKGNKFGWKAKVAEKVFYKSPLDRVECFFKINFQQTTGRQSLPAILTEDVSIFFNLVFSYPIFNYLTTFNPFVSISPLIVLN